MNKIDFLTDVKTWFEGKFGVDPVEQAKKVADAHLDAYVEEMINKNGPMGSTVGAVKQLFKNHFHLSNAVAGLQGIISDLTQKVTSLLTPEAPIAPHPDIGGDDVE